MKYTLENIIECILLVSDEPLAVSQIIKIIDDKSITKRMIEKAITNLNEQYQDKAIHINHVASGYRFQAKAGVELYISKLKEKGTNKFSKAFLETTAIIAYKQPVTRGDIEDIRGVVVSTNIMRQLLDRGWIKKDGRREVPGRPSLYKTTDHFLDYFGLKSIGELPSAADFKEPISEPLEQDSGKLL